MAGIVGTLTKQKNIANFKLIGIKYFLPSAICRLMSYGGIMDE
ncbi:hypothetical protein [Pantoea sp. Nvir]|nr:hypothetical protein [Pantoea sp. Nvir]